MSRDPAAPRGVISFHERRPPVDSGPVSTGGRRMTSLRAKRVTWTAGLAALLAGTAAAAQTSDPASDLSFTFFDIYILGGGMAGFIFLLPIQILSVATVAHTIEHFLS